MKALAWQNYLQGQEREHNKRLFTVTELANVAGVSRQTVQVELSRLRRYGILVRAGRAMYAIPGAARLEDVLPMLDARAYATGLYGLYARGVVTQAPTTIACFTDHRFFGKERETAAGRLAFSCVKPPIYARPQRGCVASAEQCLLDFVYICRRRGVDPRGQATFRKLDTLKRGELSRLARRYPRAVADQARDLLRGPRRETRHT